MDIITVLYSMSGLVFGAAFIPQVMTLIKDRSGAVSLNLSTWTIFTFCSVISLLYALTHNGDSYFIFCSSVGAVGNTAVLMLGIMRRAELRLARVRVPSPRTYRS